MICNFFIAESASIGLVGHRIKDYSMCKPCFSLWTVDISVTTTKVLSMLVPWILNECVKYSLNCYQCSQMAKQSSSWQAV